MKKYHIINLKHREAEQELAGIFRSRIEIVTPDTPLNNDFFIIVVRELRVPTRILARADSKNIFFASKEEALARIQQEANGEVFSELEFYEENTIIKRLKGDFFSLGRTG